MKKEYDLIFVTEQLLSFSCVRRQE